MPRFFFDIDDGVEIRDEVGRELNVRQILRTEALMVIARLMEAEAEDAKETTLVLTARDRAGFKLLKVRLVCQVEEL